MRISHRGVGNGRSGTETADAPPKSKDGRTKHQVGVDDLVGGDGKLARRLLQRQRARECLGVVLDAKSLNELIRRHAHDQTAPHDEHEGAVPTAVGEPLEVQKAINFGGFDHTTDDQTEGKEGTGGKSRPELADVVDLVVVADLVDVAIACGGGCLLEEAGQGHSAEEGGEDGSDEGRGGCGEGQVLDGTAQVRVQRAGGRAGRRGEDAAHHE